MEFSVLYIALFIVIAALSGTGIILFVIIKFVRPNPPEHNFNTLLLKKKQNLGNAGFNPGNIEETRGSDRFGGNAAETQKDQIDNETDEALELAHRFDRGKGEMELMMKIKSQSDDSIVKEKIKKINPDNAVKGNWTGKAKKLGVGRGEVKLLKHLEAFKNANIRSERYL